MRVLLVVNPAASSVTTRARVPRVERIAARAYATDMVGDDAPGPRGRARARTRCGEALDVVAVLAGDGTLNEAAGGLAGSDAALAPLPGGSTNVFARTLGVAYDARGRRPPARGVAPARVTPPDRPRRGSVANAGRRYFLFHLGVGFDAAVVRRDGGSARR